MNIRKFLLVGSVVLTLAGVFAWWDCGWQYRTPITITSPEAVTGYQVKIELNSTNFAGWDKIKSDCSDLRFVDSDDATLLPYWIETCDVANQKIVVWIKTDLPYGSKTIYMYYGNPSATSLSNYDAVFYKIEDDFSTDPTTKGWSLAGSAYWDSANGYVVLTDELSNEYGILQYYYYDPEGNIYLPTKVKFDYLIEYTDTNYADGVIFAFNFQGTLGATGGSLGISSGTGYGVEVDTWQNTGDPADDAIGLIYMSGNDPSTATHLAYTVMPPPNQWHTIEFEISPDYSTFKYLKVDGYIRYKFNNVALYGVYSSGSMFFFSAATGGADAKHVIDNVVIYYRKYHPTVESSLTITYGSEEVPSKVESITLVSPADGSTVYSDTVTIHAKIVTECNILFTAKLNVTTINEEYTMSCSGSDCYYTLDLNYIAEKYVNLTDSAWDGTVNYTISVSTFADTKELLASFNVPTDFNIEIVEPTGDTVMGTGFSVKIKTSSILKLRNCTFTVGPYSGAEVKNIVINNDQKTCEAFIDLSYYGCPGTPDSVYFTVTIENVAGKANSTTSKTYSIYIPTFEAYMSTETIPDAYTGIKRYVKIKTWSNVDPVLKQPTMSRFIIEVNGVNYTLIGSNGIAVLELFHKGVSPSTDANGITIPSLYDLFGDNSGTLTIKAWGVGRCDITYYAGSSTINIPETVFKVELVPPTLENGTSLEVRFLEVQGKVIDNTLENVKCNLTINGKDYEMDQNCYIYLYNDQLAEGWNTYSVKIYGLRWGLNNVSETRYAYIDPSTPYVDVIPAGSTTKLAQDIIYKAIEENKPAVVFASGVHKVNVIIDKLPAGGEFKLIASNAILEPEIKGFPIITVKVDNITIDNPTLRNGVYGIKVENSKGVKLRNVKVSNMIFGIVISNSNVTIENSNINAKVVGIQFDNSNGTVTNSYIYGQVWGIKASGGNVTITNLRIDAKVFGVSSDKYVTIENAIVGNPDTVFGVYSKGNVAIKESRIYAKVFGIKADKEGIIKDSYINAKVFGIYSSAPVQISNVTIRAYTFGAKIIGNITDSDISADKFELAVSGEGKVVNTLIDGIKLNLSYDGSFMMFRKTLIAPTVTGYTYTGWALAIFGGGDLNVTFIPPATWSYTNYTIFKIIGKIAESIESGLTANIKSSGFYALYGS